MQEYEIQYPSDYIAHPCPQMFGQVYAGYTSHEQHVSFHTLFWCWDQNLLKDKNNKRLRRNPRSYTPNFFIHFGNYVKEDFSLEVIVPTCDGSQTNPTCNECTDLELFLLCCKSWHGALYWVDFQNCNVYFPETSLQTPAALYRAIASLIVYCTCTAPPARLLSSLFTVQAPRRPTPIFDSSSLSSLCQCNNILAMIFIIITNATNATISIINSKD